MLGDNDSASNSNMTSHRKTHERHAVLSFCRVREATEAKIIDYNFFNSKINPEDVLSEHWAHHSVWKTLKPLLFWKEDTMECFDNNNLEFEE